MFTQAGLKLEVLTLPDGSDLDRVWKYGQTRSFVPV